MILKEVTRGGKKVPFVGPTAPSSIGSLILRGFYLYQGGPEWPQQGQRPPVDASEIQGDVKGEPKRRVQARELNAFVVGATAPLQLLFFHRSLLSLRVVEARGTSQMGTFFKGRGKK